MLRTVILAAAITVGLVTAAPSAAAIMIESDQGYDNAESSTVSFTLAEATSSALVVLTSNNFANGTETSAVTLDPSGDNIALSLLDSQSGTGSRGNTQAFAIAMGNVGAGDAGSVDIQFTGGNNTWAYIYQLSGVDQDLGNWIAGGTASTVDGTISTDLGTVPADSLLVVVGEWGKSNSADTVSLGGTDGNGSIAYTADQNQFDSNKQGGIFAHATVTGDLEPSFTAAISDSQDGMAMSGVVAVLVPEPASLALIGLGSVLVLTGRRRHA